MKKAFAAFFLTTAGIFPAFSDTSYISATTTYDLIAGLTNLTATTAMNPATQATDITNITDNSWSSGILNLGGTPEEQEVFDPDTGETTIRTVYVPNNGKLAGTFGGGVYRAADAYKVMIIGMATPFNTTLWGNWTVRMLLSNGSYSSAINYSDSNLFVNSVSTLGFYKTGFQELNITAFDLGDIGVTGIELSSMGGNLPDVSYIGVVKAVPEPSALSLLVVALGGLAVVRRRKS